eukprot:jgi/Mesvir1/18606/Mv17115-RA.1
MGGIALPWQRIRGMPPGWYDDGDARCQEDRAIDMSMPRYREFLHTHPEWQEAYFEGHIRNDRGASTMSSVITPIPTSQKTTQQLAQDAASRAMFSRVMRENPELWGLISYHKFPGDDEPTPVVDKAGMLLIVRKIPAKGPRFEARREALRKFCRIYLGAEYDRE